MRILYLVPHVPNPTKVRSYNQVRGLAEAGHEVTVATLVRNTADIDHLKRLHEMGVRTLSERLERSQSILNCITLLASHAPFQSAFMWSSELMTQIERHVERHPPDIIHVEHLRMARYGLRLMRNWPVIWDAVDYLSPLFRQASKINGKRWFRWLAGIEAARLPNYERWLTSQFQMTLVISNSDQALFQQDNIFAERVHTVPLGLPMPLLSGKTQRTTNCLIITGTLNYHPNVASAKFFVKEIFPLIQRQFPNIHLQLVGANPDPSISVLANSEVEITGFVPSVQDYLARATVALAPVLYGSGMQIKVIEAFMTATPLVATSVALRGLDIHHEEHVLVADTADDFATAVLRLLHDNQLRERIGRAGRAYVKQYHDLQVTTKQLVECYVRVRERFQRPA